MHVSIHDSTGRRRGLRGPDFQFLCLINGFEPRRPMLLSVESRCWSYVIGLSTSEEVVHNCVALGCGKGAVLLTFRLVTTR